VKKSARKLKSFAARFSASASFPRRRENFVFNRQTVALALSIVVASHGGSIERLLTWGLNGKT